MGWDVNEVMIDYEIRIINYKCVPFAFKQHIYHDNIYVLIFL